MSTPQSQTQNEPDEIIAHFYLLTCQIGQSEMNTGEVAFFGSTFNFVGSDSAGNTTAVLSFEYLSIIRFRMYERHSRIRLELPRGLVDEWASVSGFSFCYDSDAEVVPFILTFTPADMGTFKEGVAPVLAAVRSYGRASSVISYASNGDGAVFASENNPHRNTTTISEEQGSIANTAADSQEEESQVHVESSQIEVTETPQEYAVGTTPPVSSTNDDDETPQQHQLGGNDESQQHHAEEEDTESPDHVPATPVVESRSKNKNNVSSDLPNSKMSAAALLLHEHAESPKTGPLVKETCKKNSKVGGKRSRVPEEVAVSLTPVVESTPPVIQSSTAKATSSTTRGKSSSKKKQPVSATSNWKPPVQTRGRSVSSAPRCRSTTVISEPSESDDDMPVSSFKATAGGRRVEVGAAKKKGTPVVEDEEDEVFDFDVSAFASKDFGVVITESTPSKAPARGKQKGGKAPAKAKAPAPKIAAKPTPTRPPTKKDTKDPIRANTTTTSASASPPKPVSSSTAATTATSAEHELSSSSRRRTLSILDEEEDFTPRRSHTAPPPTTMPRQASRPSPPSSSKSGTLPSTSRVDKNLFGNGSGAAAGAPRSSSNSLDEKDLSAMLAGGLPDDDQLDTFLGSALALVQKRRMSRRRAESVGPNLAKTVEGALRAHTASTASHRSAFINIHTQRISKLEEVLMSLVSTQDNLRQTVEASLAEISSTTTIVLDALVKTRAKLARDSDKWRAAEEEELDGAISSLNDMVSTTA